MSFSTFDKNYFLKKAVSELNAYVPFDKKEQTDKEKKLQGSINNFKIQKHDVSHELRDPAEDFITRTHSLESEESKNIVTTKKKEKMTITQNPPIEKHNAIKIAILKPKKSNQEKVEETKAAIQHLRELENKTSDNSKHPTQFIQHFLYHGKGGKVSMVANGGDSFEWITNHDISNQVLLKEILAQIFLGIAALHSAEKVHRDIKLENCLIHIKGQMHVVVADIDTIVCADQKKLSIIFTPGLLSPECKDVISYKNAAKKPVDCYALGATIKYLFEQCDENGEHNNDISPILDKETHRNLYQLTLDLTNKDPAHRFTIKQAMESPYFGNTPEARKIYFDKISKKHASTLDEYFDTYYYNPKQDWYPEFDIAFLMLPEPLKEIYMQGASLATQLKLIYEFPFTFDDVIRVVHRINKLEALIAAYTHHNSPLNVQLEAIFKLFTFSLTVAKKHLAPWSCFIEGTTNNGEDLLHFFEHRTEDEKKDDFIAVFERLAKLLERVKNKAFTNYQRSILGKIKEHHIATEKLPKLTALTHILLFKAENPKKSSHIQHDTANELCTKRYSRYRHVNKVVNGFLNPEPKRSSSTFYKPMRLTMDAISIEMTSASESDQSQPRIKLD